MPFRFFPTEESFYESFRTQARILEKAAGALKHLLEQYQGVEEQVKHIEDLEHEGDSIVREVALRLYKTFITPLDREDIHELVSDMDDVVDYIRAAAVRLVLFDVKTPRPPAHALANVLVKATSEVSKAIIAMEQKQDVTLYTERIRACEKEGDEINREAVGALFRENIREIEVVQWMAIYDRLETALDRCEDVAQILEGVMLKNA